MFPPLSHHSTDETKLIDIWQLFCITALIMLARIMNLLKSGNIPYPISISEEERGLVLSSTILQYFYKQKTLNILFWQMRLRASAGCERKSKHSTRSDYKAAVKIGCLEFSSVYTKCCLIIGFNLFVNIPLKIPIKIPATSPERIKIGR